MEKFSQTCDLTTKVQCAQILIQIQIKKESVFFDPLFGMFNILFLFEIEKQ